MCRGLTKGLSQYLNGGNFLVEILTPLIAGCRSYSTFQRNLSPPSRAKNKPSKKQATGEPGVDKEVS
jgi:hypothetical protein